MLFKRESKYILKVISKRLTLQRILDVRYNKADYTLLLSPKLV